MATVHTAVSYTHLNCHLVNSTVAGHETGAYNYIGGSQIGGLAGWNQSAGEITGCSVTTSSVLGNRYVGGVVGTNNGLVSQTFVRNCVKEENNWIGSKYYKNNNILSAADVYKRQVICLPVPLESARSFVQTERRPAGPIIRWTRKPPLSLPAKI